MFALQMAYFTVGNTTMAVTNAAAAPVGIMCNVTEVASAHYSLNSTLTFSVFDTFVDRPTQGTSSHVQACALCEDHSCQ